MLVNYNHADVEKLVAGMATIISDLCGTGDFNLFPVPGGGAPVAYLLKQHFPKMRIVDELMLADIVVDAAIETGATMARYQEQHDVPFVALVDKRVINFSGHIYFPWDFAAPVARSMSVEDAVIKLLEHIGEDRTREGLVETPARVAKAWLEVTSGYRENVADILKVFEDGAENSEMVIRKDIPFWSNCEHHMLPVFGTVTVAYIPNGRIIGLSKIDRLVQVFARRLQVQERMTTQIADAIQEHLKPLGVAVYVKARHACVESRGVRSADSTTITSAIRGAFEEPACRAEFMAIAKGV